MEKVIFLDVDGVLNNNSTKDRVQGYIGIDNSLVANLAQLVKRFKEPISIVLTTTWADEWYRDIRDKDLQDEFANTLDEKLRQFNMHAIDKIADVHDYYRGYQIELYLKQHPEIKEYVVLDDCTFDFDETTIKDHVVLCDETYGFQKEDIYLAESILQKTKES